MSVSPYSLEGLYNKGVLDYVPYELCNGANVGSLNGAQNPYLNMAKQGGLYQNYNTDNFQLQNTQNNYSNCADSILCNNSREVFMNSMQEGGFGEKVSDKEKSKSFNLIKGLIAGGIIIGTTYLCLKGKKQPSSENFLSKLKFWKK